MARMRIKNKSTKALKTKYRKSKLVKDTNGLYHCPTCGVFRPASTKRKKK